MNFTTRIAATYKISPFDVLNEDTENVIMLINFYVESDETDENNTCTPQKHGKDERIKVNDKTASGGWF